MQKKIISIVNHKGGVGKTTTAVNIAAGLAERRKNVLLIDLDPQGSASYMLGVHDDGTNFFNALQKTQPLPLLSIEAAGIDLVPSGPNLVEARQRFSGAIGAELLSRCLQRTEGDWQFVIIDCPPSLGILTRNAFLASNEVIIPVETNFLAFAGLHQMIETIETIQSRKQDFELLGIIPCRVHVRRRIHREFLEKLNEQFADKVGPEVRESVVLAEAPGRGQPVTAYAPKSRSAEDYRRVVKWLLKKCK